MDILAALKEKLKKAHAHRWEELPDMGLYMDQVLSLMRGQMLDDGTTLTAAMINNYTNAGLLPRPIKKKYTREHIARLKAISVFKQVLSVADTKTLIEQYHTELHQPDIIYDRFLDLLDETLSEASARIEAGADREALRRFAVTLALSAYSQRLICETVVRALRHMEEDPDGPPKLPQKGTEHP